MSNRHLTPAHVVGCGALLLLAWSVAGGCRRPATPDGKAPDTDRTTGTTDAHSATGQPRGTDQAGDMGGTTMRFTIQSAAFASGAPIPQKYTGEGPDMSPPLTWAGAPAGTVEFALIVDDPDAPTPEPWVHWVIYKIPATATALGAGVARTASLAEPAGALQGVNSWTSNNVGYRGPMPPVGHGVHHYHFKLYALDAALPLAAGATKAQVLAAMQGHVLATAELIGTYER